MAKLKKITLWDWLPGRSWRIVANVENANDIPEKLPPRGAILVGTLEHPKWLAFDCPCKSGHRIMITLDLSHRPHWSLHGNSKLTVSPSIDFHSPEKRCHFFLRRGKIEWARNLEVGNHVRKR